MYTYNHKGGKEGSVMTRRSVFFRSHSLTIPKHRLLAIIIII